jgi:hypothetical protein
MARLPIPGAEIKISGSAYFKTSRKLTVTLHSRWEQTKLVKNCKIEENECFEYPREQGRIKQNDLLLLFSSSFKNECFVVLIFAFYLSL